MGNCCSHDVQYGAVVADHKDKKEYEAYDEDDDVRIGEGGAIVRLQGSSTYISMFTKQGKKGINQDAMTVWENFTGEKEMFFCGVFDGHGPLGHKIARHVCEKLPSKLYSMIKMAEVNGYRLDDIIAAAGEKNLALGNGGGTGDSRDYGNLFFRGLEASLIKSFEEVDEELYVISGNDSFWSGTTAVTIIKQGDHLVIANLGDSRAVLGTRGNKNQLVPIQLTVDLKPNVPSEARRIKSCRGRIFAMDEEPNVYRIWMPEDDWPGLAMARAFGDFCLKDYGLISTPEIFYRKLTSDDEFVVLATDGVWDVLTISEVVKIVASVKDRSLAAKTLISYAARAWRSKYPGSRADDCAAICLFLKNQPELSRSASEMNQVSVTNAEFTVYDSSAPSKHHPDHECLDGKVTTEAKEEWNALDGITRVNSLVNRPQLGTVLNWS